MSANSGAISAKRSRNTSGLRPWKPGQSGNPSGRPKGQRSTAIAVLVKLGDQNAWVQCYRMAEEQKDVRAMVEILRYLTDRRDGKAFIAENPAVQQKADALRQDMRLQAAIRELNIGEPKKATHAPSDARGVDSVRAQAETVFN